MTTTDRPAQDHLAPMLQDWASGLLAYEAAVDMLIATGLHVRIAGDPAVVQMFPDDAARLAAIDWHALREHATTNPYSGGERRLLMLACGLAGEAVPIDVSSFDAKHLALVLAAVTHAAGWHQRARGRYE